MQNRFGLLDIDVMPMFMIMPRYSHNYAFSVNCSTVICSPTVIYAILREATSETYGPWSTLHYISFRSIIRVYYLFCNLYFPINTTKIPKYLSYYLYQISLLQVAMKGLTTPLSRWLRVVCLFV